jgi:hypothetical protein
VAAATHRFTTGTARQPAPRGADDVVIGGTRYDLADVVSYEVEAEEERDCAGQILCCAIYGVSASVMLIAMVIGGLDWKFIIGVVFVAAIALMCLADALAVKPVTIYRLRMLMSDGRSAVFAAGAWEPTAALAARIHRLANQAAA